MLGVSFRVLSAFLLCHHILATFLILDSRLFYSPSNKHYVVTSLQRLSTNSWLSLFLLLDWIHPSIDQECSQAEDDHMTPGTFYTNKAISLKMGCPVFRMCFCLSVTPKLHLQVTFLTMFLEEDTSFLVWKDHQHPPFTSSSKRYCTHHVISLVWQSYT